MKIALTTPGDSLESPLDPRFGRAPKFLIYDSETDTCSIVDNRQNVNAPQGDGVQAADTMVRAGVTHVVTGNCGPKAFRVLKAAGVSVYTTKEGTVNAALKAFLEGKLKAEDSATVESHFA